MPSSTFRQLQFWRSQCLRWLLIILPWLFEWVIERTGEQVEKWQR
jgi:hypothetical protein